MTARRLRVAICAFAGFWLVPAPAAADECVAVDTGGLEWSAVEALHVRADVGRWVELGETVIVCSVDSGLAARLGELPVVGFAGDIGSGGLWVSRGLPASELQAAGWTVVATDGPYAVVAGGPTAARLDLEDDHPGCRRPAMRRIDASAIVVRAAARPWRQPATVFSPSVGERVAAIDPLRWESDVATLASWNRYTLSPGVLAARDWLVSELSTIPGLDVTTQELTVWGMPAFNVIATLAGVQRPDEWYVVGAHYDSTSESPSTAAPGAEDNASGCAAVVEIARVLAADPPAATVVFTCFTGEEQGLYGSQFQVAQFQASGDDAKIQAMLNMDMIAFTEDLDLDVLLESEAIGEDLIQLFDDAAAAYTSLRTEVSLVAFGSDHVSYLDADIAAVLTIENDWDAYPDYHRTTDTPDKLTRDMAYEILKMNVAAIAHLAETGTLVFRDGFEDGTTSSWSWQVPPP